MVRLAFAAHDPGGANALSAVAGAARARGDAITCVAAGPALDAWHAAGEVCLTSLDALLVAHRKSPFDVLVSATGFSRFESAMWAPCRAQGMDVLAVIEGWSNFRERFEGADGRLVLPDAIGVVDEESRKAITREAWCVVPVYVVGQPHLQRVARDLRAARLRREPAAPPSVAFFSEPIDKDYGRDRRGFDQFEIAAHIAAALPAAGASRVIVKPHPREGRTAWMRRLEGGAFEGDVVLSESSPFDVLIGADAVVGMTSAVLLEAALGGVPTLSVQIGRKDVVHPVVERYLDVVTRGEDLAAALARLLSRGDRRVPAELLALSDNAQNRFLAAVDACSTAKSERRL